MKQLLIAVAILTVNAVVWAQGEPPASSDVEEITAAAEGAPAQAPVVEADAKAKDAKDAAGAAVETEVAAEPLRDMSPEQLEALIKRLVQQELAKERGEGEGSTTGGLGQLVGGNAAPTQRNMEGFILPDFSKTGITFIMGDDNLRDDSQYSVSADIGQRPEYEEFFDRFYGYSNTAAASTRLALYHQQDGLIENLSTRIGLAFKLYSKMDNIDDSLRTDLVEDKSFIELEYTLFEDHRLMLTLFPYNADRIAIGYFRGLRWGTRDVYPQVDKSAAIPGFQFLYGHGPISVYGGFKTHAQDIKDKLNTEFVPKETVYSGFGGVALKDLHGLSAHVQAAVVDKGENPVIDDEMLDDPGDDQINAYGLNLFAEYALGEPIGDPLGINAYQSREWMSPSYEGDWAFRVRAEYTYLAQLLGNGDYLAFEDGDVVEPRTAVEDAHGFAVGAAGRFRMFRLMGLFTFRTLSFLVFDAPGVIPFETATSLADTSPEIAGTVHADAHFSIFWFGAGFGVKMPATYTIEEGGQNYVSVFKDRITSNTLSYAFDRTRNDLPPGEEAADMFFVKGNIKAEVSESVSAMVEYTFTMDHNRAKLVEFVEGGEGAGVFIMDWDDEAVRNIHALVFSVEGRF